jgi:hypothetical protein
MVSLFLERYCG